MARLLKIKFPVWLTGTGIEIPVNDMEASHIRNAIRCLEGRGRLKIPTEWIRQMGGRDYWLKILNDELDRRFKPSMTISIRGLKITATNIDVPAMNLEILTFLGRRVPGRLLIDDAVIEQRYVSNVNENKFDVWLKKARLKALHLSIKTKSRDLVLSVRPRSYQIDHVNAGGDAIETMTFCCEGIVRDKKIE